MPRSGWFRRSPPPVRLDELPGTVKAWLVADAGFPAWVEVHAEQEFPPETGKVSPPWGRVSVWLWREAPLVGLREPTPDGQARVTFIVQVEAAPDPEARGGWDYLRTVADLHDRVFAAVNGRKVAENWREETIGGKVYVTEDVLPVWAQGMVTEGPVRDDGSNVWMQACRYQAVLVRKPKE